MFENPFTGLDEDAVIGGARGGMMLANADAGALGGCIDGSEARGVDLWSADRCFTVSCRCGSNFLNLLQLLMSNLALVVYVYKGVSCLICYVWFRIVYASSKVDGVPLPQRAGNPPRPLQHYTQDVIFVEC
ncbi:hypothetical protein VNO78_03742 [Psophocarpus tetragonolobus]|uniref:Uncharacterized protein n=1 Tax=Psophocarpus tetragonolobus TaxID=3891 RepID=A0AAN9XX79_PSOTE